MVGLHQLSCAEPGGGGDTCDLQLVDGGDQQEEVAGGELYQLSCAEPGVDISDL